MSKTGGNFELVYGSGNVFRDFAGLRYACPERSSTSLSLRSEPAPSVR